MSCRDCEIPWLALMQAVHLQCLDVLRLSRGNMASTIPDPRWKIQSLWVCPNSHVWWKSDKYCLVLKKTHAVKAGPNYKRSHRYHVLYWKFPSKYKTMEVLEQILCISWKSFHVYSITWCAQHVRCWNTSIY